MKIVLYNFIQPDEPGSGGVGIYTNNLANKLVNQGHEVVALSSGDRYSFFDQRPRLTFEDGRYARAIVVNSPVVAPAYFTFRQPDDYEGKSELDFVPAKLAQQYGSIDVFHFQNLEGLNRSFFRELRRAFPAAKILFSVHNYHLMCSRVTLWQENRRACVDYRDGVACTLCGMRTFDLTVVRRERRIAHAKKTYPRLTLLAGPALRLARAGWHVVKRLRARPSPNGSPAVTTLPPATARAYAAFRKLNIQLCHDIFDSVLAVSERTRQVLVDRGVPAAKVSVSYIGTAYKETYLHSRKIADIGDGLHLGYIGYMTRDKGFQFLLEALEQLPDSDAATITVTIAARNTDDDAFARVKALEGRYRKVRYFDGYTHSNLDEVLQGVNLGLIPVLWEDNLPQTAIELVSRGIPILTSDRGGAQEIASNPRFTFPASVEGALAARLLDFQHRRVGLNQFWTGPMRIFSMDEHVADLMRYYKGSSSPNTSGVEAA